MFVLLLFEDGTILCGGDFYGEDGSKNNNNMFNGFRNIKDIACGKNHIILLTDDNVLHGFGNNDNGQLSVPKSLVSGVEDVKLISCSDKYSTIVFTNNDIMIIGKNTFQKRSLYNAIRDNLEYLSKSYICTNEDGNTRISINLKIKKITSNNQNLLILLDDGSTRCITMERQSSPTIETYPFPYFEDCTKDGILINNGGGLKNLDVLEFSSSCAFTRDSFRKLIQIYNDGKDKFIGRVFGNEESVLQMYKEIRNPIRIFVTHISSFNKTTFILLSDGTARIGQQYGSFGFGVDRYSDDVRGLTIISDESNLKPTREPFTVFTYPIDLILDATSIKSTILSEITSGIHINFKTEPLPLVLTFKKNNLVQHDKNYNYSVVVPTQDAETNTIRTLRNLEKSNNSQRPTPVKTIPLSGQSKTIDQSTQTNTVPQSEYLKKYLKYKNKYLALKNKI